MRYYGDKVVVIIAGAAKVLVIFGGSERRLAVCFSFRSRCVPEPLSKRIGCCSRSQAIQ